MEDRFHHPYWKQYPVSDRIGIVFIHSNASYGLGVIAKRLGQWDLAQKYLEEAIRQPNSWIDPMEMRSHLVEILLEHGPFKEASIQYQPLMASKEAGFFDLNR